MRLTREEAERCHKAALGFLLAFEDADDFIFVMLTAPEAWDIAKDPIHMPFGYARPFLNDEGVIEWPVCCELVARQTSHLSLDQFNDYLTYVVAHTSLHIAYLDEDYTLGDLEQVIDSTLFETLHDQVLAVAQDVMHHASS